jgi:hypothetical protein
MSSTSSRAATFVTPRSIDARTFHRTELFLRSRQRTPRRMTVQHCGKYLPLDSSEGGGFVFGEIENAIEADHLQ